MSLALPLDHFLQPTRRSLPRPGAVLDASTLLEITAIELEDEQKSTSGNATGGGSGMLHSVRRSSATLQKLCCALGLFQVAQTFENGSVNRHRPGVAPAKTFHDLAQQRHIEAT